MTLRIDADVVEYFRKTGPGWQTRINDTLRRATKLRRPHFDRQMKVARAVMKRRRNALRDLTKK